MVVGGTVTVNATVNGQPQEAQVKVEVTPRNWSGKIQYPSEPTLEVVGGPPLLYPPIASPADELKDGVLGLFRGVAPRPTYDSGSGPNAGWTFINAPPVFTGTPRIWINRALEPSDPFFRAQTGNPPGMVVGIRMCDRQFMLRVYKNGNHLTLVPAGQLR